MNRRSEDTERVVRIKRRAGPLREIHTSRERRFLVVKGPAVSRFLEVGAALGPGEADELKESAARPAGLELAYRMLARRDRTEYEIRRALLGEGIDGPGVVDGITATLKGQGYLDDRRMAEGFIRYTMRHRPAGPHLLRRKLRDLGIDEETVESTVHAAFADHGERDVAVELAARRIDPRLEPPRAVRRIHGLLTRRGFSSHVVNDVCAMIMRGEISREDG